MRYEAYYFLLHMFTSLKSLKKICHYKFCNTKGSSKLYVQNHAKNTLFKHIFIILCKIAALNLNFINY